MKRFVCLLATVPFWYFALAVPSRHFAAQFGPFPDKAQCQQLALIFTTPPSHNPPNPPSPNPFFIPGAIATSCWAN